MTDADALKPLVRINPDTLGNVAGMSQVTIAEPGRLAFLSGQVAWEKTGGETPPDLKAQTELAADNVERALAAIDATAEDIVMLRFYVSEGTSERLEEAWSVLERRFGAARPSVTALGVAALATPSLQVEVEVVARTRRSGEPA